ncbi:phosphatase PAP2 family protein [Nocardia stercoris]|uniref:Phosphatase PAP2 family protein n=1 Tax=Nocardia stercoris TaxID=2483361 RepID=A0A3M2L729_9NOCA|nr:phosphatase PAP2 family protein [Nocardia stercoris]RMI33449.1 phosphatase PAP2 family protein [Nocardia stercoris]
MSLDTRIFYDINDFSRHTPWLHPIVSGYAAYGVVLFAALLLAGWWIARAAADPRRMVAAVWAPLGLLAAMAISQPIAAAVDRTRPCNALHDIVVLHCNTDGSLPSDHAVMVGAVTAGLWLVNRRLALISALAAVVMVFARVYIGAHYPLDVLAGLALGAAVSLIGYLPARPTLGWALTFLTRTPLRVLITASPEPVPAPRAS